MKSNQSRNAKNIANFNLNAIQVKQASKVILGSRTHMMERNTPSWVML